MVCVYTRKEGLTECFLVTQGTQLVPLGDKSVPKMCLFIRLQIFRAWSKSFYWLISQVRFLSLKSQALTQPHNLKILDQQPGLLFTSPVPSVPSSDPLCSVEGDCFKFPAQH